MKIQAEKRERRTPPMRVETKQAAGGPGKTGAQGLVAAEQRAQGREGSVSPEVRKAGS